MAISPKPTSGQRRRESILGITSGLLVIRSELMPSANHFLLADLSVRIRLVPIWLVSSTMPQGNCGSFRSATGKAQSLAEQSPLLLLEGFIRSALPRIWPLCHSPSSRSLGECLPVQAVYVCHHLEP
jgi:hypothetical protein